jgi:hypothetical protein
MYEAGDFFGIQDTFDQNGLVPKFAILGFSILSLHPQLPVPYIFSSKAVLASKTPDEVRPSPRFRKRARSPSMRVCGKN